MMQFTLLSISTRMLVILCGLLLPGCVQVNLPQVNALYQMMVPPADPLDQHRWDLQVGEYKTQVYLLTIDGQRVFANEAQDILILNDDTLTTLLLPTVTDAQINISDTSNEQGNITRTVTVNDVLFERQACGAWQTQNIDKHNANAVSYVSYVQEHDETTQSSQTTLVCAGAKTQQHFLVYANDELQQLSQYIPYIDQQISLTKVSTR